MDIISELLSTQWWQYSFVDFCDLDLGNPERFIHQFVARKPHLSIDTPARIEAADLT